MRGMNFGNKGKLLMYLGFLTIATVMVMPAYADQVVKLTNGGTIDVGLATDPANPTPGSTTNFQIAFINKSTQAVQVHIDYKISVMEGSNQICGTSILHTSEGSITYPCQLPDAATYQVIVEVDGILFQPIPPETATFTINTEGGSTPSASSTTNASSTTSTSSATTSAQPSGTPSAVIPSWIKNNAKWWSQGQIGDDQFIKGLQYMIQNGIIQIPAQSGGSATASPPPIPAWIKTNAGWWADGQISDGTFVTGIQWLISNGIIVV